MKASSFVAPRYAPFLAIGASAAILGGCGSIGFERDDAFQGRVYAGAGALVSQLEPDTDNVADITLDEDTSAGGTVLLGYDISNRFSIEGSYSMLGEATFEPQGSIDYTVYGLSGLVYVFNDSRDRARREGLSLFGRLGVGGLENDSTVEYERLNDFHLLAGLGIEYGFANGIGLRAELAAHEADARYAQLGVVYRFGEAGRSRPQPISSEKTTSDAATTPRTSPIALPEAPVERLPVDGDADGVRDTTDDCPGTRPGRPVDVTGCDVFDGTNEGLSFESGSDTLTAGAKSELDSIAATLQAYPAIDIAIEAHTDNTGDADLNLQLSRGRAIAVARYLVSQGVSGDRLKPRAYGESQPLVSNADAAGRARNRRVELRVVE